ncbi:hypothetical protein SB776_34885, partial [Burkholderia sp. SIMBA_045]
VVASEYQTQPPDDRDSIGRHWLGAVLFKRFSYKQHWEPKPSLAPPESQPDPWPPIQGRVA